MREKRKSRELQGTTEIHSMTRSRQHRSDSGLEAKSINDLLGGRVFVLVFVLLATGIIATGVLYYRKFERQFRTGVEHQLSAIADLKASELAQWRVERLGDGDLFFQNATISKLVRNFFESPNNAEAHRQILAWLEKCQRVNRYDEVRLIDVHGLTRMAFPSENRTQTPQIISQSIPKVLQANRVMFQDFYRDEKDHRVYLAVMVPIFDDRDNKIPLGLFVLRVDPGTYLYPFISSWPMPSRTAETLLARQEGNDVIFLNDLRFQANAALNLRVSLKYIARPAAQAVLGREGIMEGIDYRGAPVVAALRKIPDSPWSLVARMDTAEIYAPIRDRLWLVGFITSGLLFGAGAWVGLIWRHQRARFYREQVKIAEALKKSEQGYRELFENMLNGFAWGKGAPLFAHDFGCQPGYGRAD
jgi:hypothetical protein